MDGGSANPNGIAESSNEYEWGGHPACPEMKRARCPWHHSQDAHGTTAKMPVLPRCPFHHGQDAHSTTGKMPVLLLSPVPCSLFPIPYFCKKSILYQLEIVTTQLI
ncbi:MULTISPECIES: hypothetical protein [Moorena]|uniref:hypothetical protein n=1 Tax=Moorena TaxID=1155738 RepID=UPI0010558F63|nr:MULTISPECIES: hypothetical protein [Moorena]NEQ15278.1 hypothetical protein [Moorena sp. SIO3E2]NEP32969.1 hypothetical protein [Moorena sp. SIO3B2]NEP68579.1 hypothetical protein [Moorena sp. SIO3A5]NEQ06743.1 hypothetical protein [Moorena sp. SIO4E2]NER91212.1 hypothetical protein [Moorena sp. SIO3A2]